MFPTKRKNQPVALHTECVAHLITTTWLILASWFIVEMVIHKEFMYFTSTVLDSPMNIYASEQLSKQQ